MNFFPLLNLGFHIFMQESTVSHLDQSFLSIPDGLPSTPLTNDVLESCGLISNLDLPKTVARILNEESSPMSMDFHPVQQNVLLGLFFYSSYFHEILR